MYYSYQPHLTHEKTEKQRASSAKKRQGVGGEKERERERVCLGSGKVSLRSYGLRFK
jgi:hypothetical protein